MRFFSVLLACSFVGCAHRELPCRTDEGGVAMTYRPSDFGDADVERLRAAGRKWSALAGREIVSLRPEERAGQCTITRDAAFGANRAHLAWANADEGTIRIAPVNDCGSNARYRGDDCFENIVLHEIGHMLGLEHVKTAPAVMFHEATSLEFSDADRAECQRAGICR